MTCCDAPGLMPIDEAIAIMQAKVTTVTATESVQLHLALDRILAEDIYSALDVPPQANSAMDGFALHAQDQNLNMPLKLVGETLAGHPYKGSCGKGECIRIMTGAIVPHFLDAVVMQENTSIKGEQVTVVQWPTSGSNIRLAGEDIAKGQQVFSKGKRLSPTDLGLLASLGVAHVPVYRKLRVAIIATGDELVTAGEIIREGQIYESNSLVVCAMLTRLNVDIKDYGIVKDDLTTLTAVFEEANQWADVVISSGGVSVGVADYTKTVLENLGTIGFWKLAIKPGKPFAFGTLSQSTFFGLPGNPVSATVTFHQLALPIMRQMQGELVDSTTTFQVECTEALKKRPGRQDYQRGTLSQLANGQLQVSGFRSQGSGVLSSMSQSNCYMILPQNAGNVAIGDKVTVLPFDRFIG